MVAVILVPELTELSSSPNEKPFVCRFCGLALNHITRAGEFYNLLRLHIQLVGIAIAEACV